MIFRPPRNRTQAKASRSLRRRRTLFGFARLTAVVLLPFLHVVSAGTAAAQPCKFLMSINGDDDEAFGVALQSDGKVILAGYTALVDPEDNFALARYDPDCTLDTTFNPTGTYGGAPNLPGIVTTDISTNDRDRAIDVVIQPDGKILATGFSRTGGTVHRIALVRYLTDGQLDTTFGGGTGIVTTNLNGIDDQGRAVAVQADNKIVVAGWTRTGACGGYPNQCLDTVVLRYLPNGTLDTSGFNSPNGYVIANVAGGTANDFGHSVAIQSPGGEIVVGGDDDFDIHVLRFNPGGTPDTSWGGTGTVTTDVASAGNVDVCRDVVIQPDGKILAVGTSGNAFAVTRYTSTGGLDGSFDGDGHSVTALGSTADWNFAVALQSDNKIVTSGWTRVTGAPDHWDFGLVRYETNGLPDAGFGTGGIVTTPIGFGDDTAFDLAIEADGEIAVVGSGHNGTNLDFAFVRYAANGTTEVTLSTFLAKGSDRAVELEWETASELNNLGFHLYRSESADGPYERITATLIPGLGSSPSGAIYTYRDEALTNGVTYHYALEDIETTGKTSRHGPVSATPREAVPRCCRTDDDDGASERVRTRITVGDPSDSSTKVVRRSRHEVVLELETGGFYAEPQPDGSVRLAIPGFEPLAETSPAVPVKRTWVEALAGRKVKLVSVRSLDVEAFTGLRPSDAETPEIVASRDGTVRATFGPTRSRGSADAGSRRHDLYPAEAARLVSVGFQADVKKALVELAPLRWDEAKQQLILARRLSVRLSFLGTDPRDRSTDGVHGRRLPNRRSHDERDAVARLVTKAKGLYGVRFEDVFGGRRGRGVAADEIRLSRQGDWVAFHVEPDPSRYERGSTLYFLGEGASANPYGSEVVYELEMAGGGRAMPVIDAAPWGERTDFYWKRLELEHDRWYQPGLVDAPDRWLWDMIFAPDAKTYDFEVRSLSPVAEDPRLEIWLQGASDFPASPDHHVRVYLNGTLVEELSFEGKQAKKLDLPLLRGLVRAGGNRLKIENVGDTDATYSMVMLNRFVVEYPADPRADEGVLEGRWDQSGIAEVSRLALGTKLLDVTEELPRWLRGAELGTDADGTARFRVERGRSYLALSPEAVLRAEVRRPLASELRNTRNEADFLVVGPSELVEAAGELLEHRARQGLRALGVSLEQVSSEFGFGEDTPESIRDFLSYAYHRWSVAPRYVVLLGDASFDFKDHLQTGVRNQVPPLMIKTTYLWTASDPTYAAVNGDDGLPDLAIGRLPAATVEELRAMVAKIVTYEQGALGLGLPVVLVADNPDAAGDFEANAEALASSVLAARAPRKIYLGHLGAAASREAINTALDEGASVVSYIGHGGIHLWAQENIFNTSDVASLAPRAHNPLVLTLNCLNGYFHFPYFDSLSEELVKAEGRGAVAAFSPSGLSLDRPAHLFHQALLNELFNGGHERLGDAVMAAQQTYATTGAFPELLSIYHLLGDPALRLR